MLMPGGDGYAGFSHMFAMVTADGMKWDSLGVPNPDVKRSEYVVAYMSLAAGQSVLKTLQGPGANGGGNICNNTPDGTAGDKPYTCSQANVDAIATAHCAAIANGKKTADMTALRGGNYANVPSGPCGATLSRASARATARATASRRGSARGPTRARPDLRQRRRGRQRRGRERRRHGRRGQRGRHRRGGQPRWHGRRGQRRRDRSGGQRRDGHGRRGLDGHGRRGQRRDRGRCRRGHDDGHGRSRSQRRRRDDGRWRLLVRARDR